MIHRELENGILWPVYWLYGSEKLKSKELFLRIKKACFKSDTSAGASLFGSGHFGEENLDGDETTASSIVDAAQSLTLGGGLRLITVRDAHLLKNQDELAPLLGPAGKKEDLNSVCVFFSKDLDGRKKFTKLLLEKAAVVPCEEVPDAQREGWILYLSKRRGIQLSDSMKMTLCSLEPWSLELIDQELEKYSVAQSEEVLLGGTSKSESTEFFIETFFNRDLKSALPCVSYFADEPSVSLPLLGLLGWNVRQLCVYLLDLKNNTRHTKINPFFAERLRVWSGKWSLDEALELQQELADLDFNLKQRPFLPIGLWSQLVIRFLG